MGKHLPDLIHLNTLQYLMNRLGMLVADVFQADIYG